MRWVVLQVLLFAAYCLQRPMGPEWPWPEARAFAGWASIAIGAVMAGGGFAALGRKLSPLPRPAADGRLITTGMFGVVRHPMYSGLVLAAAGWAIAHANLPQLVMAAAIGVFLDLKATHEEALLAARFPNYADYQRQVRKMIPWVY